MVGQSRQKGSIKSYKFASKVPYLTLPIALFIAAVVNTPRRERPWGIIIWIAQTFQISRPTVYAIGERVALQLQNSPQVVVELSAENRITITTERINRTMQIHGR